MEKYEVLVDVSKKESYSALVVYDLVTNSIIYNVIQITNSSI